MTQNLKVQSIPNKIIGEYVLPNSMYFCTTEWDLWTKDDRIQQFKPLLIILYAHDWAVARI